MGVDQDGEVDGIEGENDDIRGRGSRWECDRKLI